MKITRPVHKPFPVLLAKRVCLFLLFICALSLWLYALGNAQGFMEKTNLMLLGIAASAGVAAVFASIAGIILSLPLLFSGKFRYMIGIVFYVLAAVLGCAAAVFSYFLLILAGGV